MSDSTSTKKPSLLMPALRHYLFWLVDMATAIVGFVYGFGLEVKSWPALIGILLVSRWVSFVGFSAHDLGVRRKQLEARE